jgi:phosphonate transport system ATP-binding protein
VLAGRLGLWPVWKGFASLFYPMDSQGAQQMLARMEIADKLFERCDQLSGGQLQRVGVARVLYQQPDLILTDEPVSAVDPALSDRVVGELNREAMTRGVTLVASLHAVDLALHWFPRVIGIRSGEVAFDLPPLKVTDAMLRQLYASESEIVPTQDNRPLGVQLPGVRRKPLCS